MGPLDHIVAQQGDAYDALPEGIKLSYTREEFMWLPDNQKATLVQRETEPDA